MIPILIDHTRMPGEADLPTSLAAWLIITRSMSIRDGDFHPHVDRLIKGIEFHFQRAKIAAARPSSQAREQPQHDGFARTSSIAKT